MKRVRIAIFGTGLTLAPNATHALDWIGLGALIDKRGLQPAQSRVRVAPSRSSRRFIELPLVL